jgi:phage terminase small subunit
LSGVWALAHHAESRREFGAVVKLSAKQRELLDALVPRRRAFALELVLNGGNQTQAAIAAGYSEDSAHVEGTRLLKDASVAAAVAALREPSENRKYRSVEQLREYWDAKIDDGGFEPKDQLKASELLGKSQAAFVERREISGPEGSPIAITIDIASAKKIARGEQNG